MKYLIAFFSALSILFGFSEVRANTSWPNGESLSVIVPFGPGGPSDAIGRIFADGLQRNLNTSVIVLNRPGSNTALGMYEMVRDKPDGRTITIVSTMTATSLPFLQKSIPYNLDRDTIVVNQVAATPLALIVRGDFPAKNVSELIENAKKNPGKLTYGTSGKGQSYHLAAVLFEQRAGIKMQDVPYKGSAPTMIDLVAGRIDMAFDAPSAALPHLSSGKLRILAVTGPKRLAGLLDVPTFEEQGLKGMDVVLHWGAFVRRETLPAIAQKLHDVFGKISREEVVTQALGRLSMSPSSCESLAACAQNVKAESNLIGKLIESIGIQPQ